LTILATDAEPEHAHVLTRVNRERAMRLARYSICIAAALDKEDENDIPIKALEALAVMQKAAESIEGIPSVKWENAFTELEASPAREMSPIPPLIRERSKKK
jgi:hypothetical protein